MTKAAPPDLERPSPNRGVPVAHGPAYAKALADADRQFSHVKTTNTKMVNAASDLLRKTDDPTEAWSDLAIQLMRGAKIEFGDHAQLLVECLSAVYIEQAQTRITNEER